LKIYNPSVGKEILNRKEIVIFDFDGVLVDSVKIKTDAFADIYYKFGKKVMNKVIAHHEQNGGMSRYDKFTFYHNEFLGINPNENDIKELSRIFSDLVVDKISKTDEVESVTEVLKYIQSKELICSIASAAPEKEVTEIVKRRGWTKFFNFILGSPASKVCNIRSILQKTKKQPSQAIFFGDSPNDLSAAKECDVDFVPINFLAENNEGFRNFL